MRHLAVAVMVGAATAAACLPDAVFECTDDEQCSALGATARCEAVRFCSIIDQNCASERRFHDYAGDGLAGLCTDVTCGDGQVVGEELCDDGNSIDADGCNADCRPSGTELWSVSYASPGNLRDRCYSVAADAQGNVTVVGHTSTEVDVDGVPTEQADIWVRQYDGTGVDVWTWVLDGANNLAEEGWSVEALPDGEFLVAASYGIDVDLTDAWVGRIDRNGLLLWEAQHDREGLKDAARDAVVAGNGDIVAIGYAEADGDRETDLWFQRFSPDGRTVKWTQYRDGFGGTTGQWAQDRGHGLAVVDGGFVGVGVRQAQSASVVGEYEQHFWIEHFDDEGNTVWADAAPAGDPGSVWTAVAAMPEGGVLLAGWRALEYGGDADMWLQQRGPQGDVSWETTIASAGDDDRANAIVVDERGGFIVGGELGTGTGSTDAWISRFAPDRSTVWTWKLSGPAGDRDTTWGVDIADDGSVYACGYQSTPGSQWDLWVRRFTP